MARGTSNSSKTAPSVPSKDSRRGGEPSPFIQKYLIAYNALSALLWSSLLLSTLLHLSGLTPYSLLPPPSTASSTVSKLASYIPFKFIKQSVSLGTQFEARLPGGLVPMWNRAKTLWGSGVGVRTTWVQSLAVLEVGHVVLGWVRSGLGSTGVQVGSRIFMVWGVLEGFESARSSPLFATLLLAWSLTEVIRYTFYTLSLLSTSYPSLLPSIIHEKIIPTLTYLRYTTFYILYPLGASSEAFLNYATLPNSSPAGGKMSYVLGKGWGVGDYARGVLFLVWWPGLYVMYTHMMRQRKKNLGEGKKVKFN